MNTNFLNPHPKFKLGKKPVRHDPRTLCLAKYVQALPPPPAVVDWGAQVTFPCGMMGNDRLGNCTCAGMGHAVQIVTANANPPEVTLSDQDILLAYEACCGYDPADPSTDQGGNELSVLSYWKNNGIGPAGHKISAYASVNPLNKTEVMQALALFGFLYTGVSLPISAQKQVGGVWDVDPTSAGAPGSWGGHCVVICQADPTGLTCITWGALQKMTWAFWTRYFDEAYACLTPDWVAEDQKSPSGFALSQLQSDLALLS